MRSKISLRDFSSAKSRLEFLEKELGINLDNIGNFTFTEDAVLGRNIENLIGATQIPLGIAGPLKLRTMNYELRTHFIPLATTEGALVASISRGCKVVNLSKGINVFVEEVGQTRGPVFKVKNLKQGLQSKKWIDDHFSDLSKVTKATSNHLQLMKIGSRLVGRNLFIRFYYDTQDAMGMNMVTIATEEAVKLIEEELKIKCVSLAGNFDIDKKPAWLNFISGRGKRVWAEATLDKRVLKEVLKTTPEKIAEVVYRKNHLGSIISGSLGFNAHFANIIAAIFLATGQDAAHIAESSLGITTAEILENGNLYFSIYLPCLIVGIVGGGTHLPCQQEALKLMKISNVLEYSQVIGACVLAGELSLIASLNEGTLAKAHIELARGKGQAERGK